MDLTSIKQKPTSANKPYTKTRPSLLKNGISNWLPLGANLVIGFFLTPYLITSLGRTNYGIWILVAHLLGYYGLLRLGVGSGIMRYVPLHIGRDDESSASEIVSTGLAILLAVGLIIFLTSMAIAEPVARFYKAGPELASLLRIMGIAAAIECPMRILDSAIRANEKWVAANIVTTATAIARAVGLVGCVHFGYGIVAMGQVVLVVAVLSTLLTMIIFVRLCPGINVRLTGVRLRYCRALIHFGIFSTVVTLASTLRLQGHSLIIGKMLSIEMVTLYGVACYLIRQVRHAVLAPTKVFWPRFAYLDGRNNKNEIASLFQRATKLVAIFSTGAMLMIFVTGPAFIRLWVGQGFEPAYAALMFLAAGYLVETSLTVTGELLPGIGRQGIHALLTLIEAILALVLGILLILRTNLALAAVPVGFLISVILIRGILIPTYICRLFGLSVIQYYRSTLLWPWLILTVLTLAAHYTKIAGFIHSWPSLFLVVLTLGVVYLACVYAFAIETVSRRKINTVVGSNIRLFVHKTRIVIGRGATQPDMILLDTEQEEVSSSTNVITDD
ncbi:MAG: lipopolysaccharide biosynthesis protein [Planctomycetota bacterium]|jgi:O-antigen/teichoic acid export membrane protein